MANRYETFSAEDHAAMLADYALEDVRAEARYRDAAVNFGLDRELAGRLQAVDELELAAIAQWEADNPRRVDRRPMGYSFTAVACDCCLCTRQVPGWVA